MTKADWLRSEIKKWFEINYLDGDEVQDGQTLASSECLDALIEYHMNFLRSEIEKLEGMIKDLSAHNFLDEQGVLDWDISQDIFDYAKDAGNNQALTSIITRYKEELKVLENGK